MQKYHPFCRQVVSLQSRTSTFVLFGLEMKLPNAEINGLCVINLFWPPDENIMRLPWTQDLVLWFQFDQYLFWLWACNRYVNYFYGPLLLLLRRHVWHKPSHSTLNKYGLKLERMSLCVLKLVYGKFQKIGGISHAIFQFRPCSLNYKI